MDRQSFDQGTWDVASGALPAHVCFGRHRDFRHRDHVLLQHWIVDVAARQHLGERVADQLADAKLALRGDRRRIVAALVFGHRIRPEKICFVML